MLLKRNRKGMEMMLGMVLICLSFSFFLEKIGSNISIIDFIIGILTGLSFTLSVAYLIRSVSLTPNEVQ